MTTFVERSLSNNSGMCDSVQEALAGVQDLDDLTEKLSAILDTQLAQAGSNGSSSSSSGGGGSRGKSSGSSNGNNNDTYNKGPMDISQLASIRRVVEDLSARKAALATHAYDLIDQATRAVDDDVKSVEQCVEMSGNDMRQLLDVYSGVKASDSISGGTSLVSANEPLYCLCNHVAFGEMISCDDDECAIEWFHYACVGLTKEPRGSAWFCPICAQNHKRTGSRRRR
jgi:hypothetical protein